MTCWEPGFPCPSGPWTTWLAPVTLDCSPCQMAFIYFSTLDRLSLTFHPVFHARIPTVLKSVVYVFTPQHLWIIPAECVTSFLQSTYTSHQYTCLQNRTSD